MYSMHRVALVKNFCHLVFNAISNNIQLYRGDQCTYPCFPGVLLTSTSHNIPSKPLVLSHITIVETTDSGERGIKLVAMSIINPWRECWLSQGSNQQPPAHKSATLLTELQAWAIKLKPDLDLHYMHRVGCYLIPFSFV